MKQYYFLAKMNEDSMIIRQSSAFIVRKRNKSESLFAGIVFTQTNSDLSSQEIGSVGLFQKWKADTASSWAYGEDVSGWFKNDVIQAYQFGLVKGGIMFE